MGNVQTYIEIKEAALEEISRRLSGGAIVSYSLAARSVQKESMASLWEIVERADDRIAMETSGGGVVYPDFR